MAVAIPIDPRRQASPAFVGVMIPARNERHNIAQAVRSVRIAMEHEAVKSASRWIVVVDDGSADGTAAIADRALGHHGEVLTGAFGGAGAARRAGFARLLRVAGKCVDVEQAWLATTDADSRVPSVWLAGHLRWWREGADAVAGMVEPIWEPDASPALRRRYEEMMARLGTGHGHPHVYGANLGFTAGAYVRAGGMPPMRTGEDHQMWAALRATGARLVSAADEPVSTSSRQSGRAPAGLAALLASLAIG
jgi:glycosyltransferase involved in cell wall biosynthesis